MNKNNVKNYKWEKKLEDEKNCAQKQEKKIELKIRIIHKCGN